MHNCTNILAAIQKVDRSTESDCIRKRIDELRSSRSRRNINFITIVLSVSIRVTSTNQKQFSHLNWISLVSTSFIEQEQKSKWTSTWMIETIWWVSLKLMSSRNISSLPMIWRVYWNVTISDILLSFPSVVGYWLRWRWISEFTIYTRR